MNANSNKGNSQRNLLAEILQLKHIERYWKIYENWKIYLKINCVIITDIHIFLYFMWCILFYSTDEPQPPRNFTCRSYNGKNITCTWDVSQHYVPTTHKLFYVIQTTGKREHVPCPTEKAKNDSCTWIQYTYPIYRQTKEKYEFVMEIQNMFGTKSFTYDNIDHFAIGI